MNKNNKKGVSHSKLGSDSPKTLIAQAKVEVPGFLEDFKKFEQQMTIGGYSESTLFNYSRAVAKVSLYFKKSLHILPHGFTRIRHYGILASRNKSKELNQAKVFFGQKPWVKQAVSWQDIAVEKLGITLDSCPKCSSTNIIHIEIFPQKRGPPTPKRISPKDAF